MASTEHTSATEVAPPPDELVVLVVRTAKALVERLRAEHPDSEDSPMTVVHGLAARYLLGRDEVTAGELSRYLKVTKQATSEVVTHLEQAGIVHRAPHPRDGRAQVLRLTDDGLDKLEAGRRRWNALADEWATLVGHDTLDVIRHGLTTYLDAELPDMSEVDGTVQGLNAPLR